MATWRSQAASSSVVAEAVASIVLEPVSQTPNVGVVSPPFDGCRGRCGHVAFGRMPDESPNPAVGPWPIMALRTGLDLLVVALLLVFRLLLLLFLLVLCL